jgi:group I intron endonuclease
MKKICGVYKLTNKLNEKIYIGQSQNIKQRWKDEFNYHRAPKILQLAIDKYGSKNFSKEVLIECSLENIDMYEIVYIRLYCSWKKEYGYNRCYGGKTNRGFKYENGKYKPPMKGKTHTEETKKIMSQKHTGKNNSMYGVHKFGIEAPNYGNHHTDEVKNQISKTMTSIAIERARNPKYIEKLRNASLGRHWWTNGTNNSFQKKCPPGWWAGRV